MAAISALSQRTFGSLPPLRSRGGKLRRKAEPCDVVSENCGSRVGLWEVEVDRREVQLEDVIQASRELVEQIGPDACHLNHSDVHQPVDGDAQATCAGGGSYRSFKSPL